MRLSWASCISVVALQIVYGEDSNEERGLSLSACCTRYLEEDRYMRQQRELLLFESSSSGRTSLATCLDPYSS
jgi:hypothetical protein